MLLDWIKPFMLAFIPLFVAVDPIGLSSVFLGITRGAAGSRRLKMANQATITAAVVAIGFIFLGEAILKALGITVSDFQVAGGLILLILAARELVTERKILEDVAEDYGIVPLGVPLVAGPATLTTLLILIQSVGLVISLAALIVNLALVNLGFRQCERLERVMGKTGLKALSKIISLLLVAIAINMIRRGLQSSPL